MAAPGLNCHVRPCGIFSCGMWDLVPWPGIEPGPPALGGQSLNHWTTREVPDLFHLNHIELSYTKKKEKKKKDHPKCLGLNRHQANLLHFFSIMHSRFLTFPSAKKQTLPLCISISANVQKITSPPSYKQPNSYRLSEWRMPCYINNALANILFFSLRKKCFHILDYFHRVWTFYSSRCLLPNRLLSELYQFTMLPAIDDYQFHHTLILKKHFC